MQFRVISYHFNLLIVFIHVEDRNLDLDIEILKSISRGFGFSNFV